MSVDDRLRELGIALPPPPKPVGSYVPFIRFDPIIFLSGMIPHVDGKLAFTGKLGGEVETAEGQQAARVCLLNALAVMKEAAGALDRIERVLRLTGFVASAPGFTQQPAVLNGASDLLVEILGERGRHTRVAVGVSELPLNAPVELEFIVAVSRG